MHTMRRVFLVGASGFSDLVLEDYGRMTRQDLAVWIL